ncbi:MAG: hypothetical protein ACYS9Y_07465 [Planctomycetota bacterium]
MKNIIALSLILLPIYPASISAATARPQSTTPQDSTFTHHTSGSPVVASSKAHH